MIRVSASLSRKLPVPGVEYSSQQYAASLEVEVSDADKPVVIQNRIRELYALLEQSIGEQITAATNGNGPVPALVPPPAPANRVGAATAKPAANAAPRTGQAGRPGNGNGNGNRRKATTATVAQQRAIFGISKALGLDLVSVLADYRVADPKDLSVRDASAVIDYLKQQQNAAAQP